MNYPTRKTLLAQDGGQAEGGAPLDFADFRSDRNPLPRSQKTLMVLDYLPHWQAYCLFLGHARDHQPRWAEQIDVLRLDDVRPERVAHYRQVVFLYHDPLLPLYPTVYRKAKLLAQYCDATNTPLMCRPEGLCNTAKSKMSALWQAHGLPCARQYKIDTVGDIAHIKGLRYPVFIRYDAGHDSSGRRRSKLYHSLAEVLAAQPAMAGQFGAKKHFGQMVATEFIDTQWADGYYRKYRSWVSGDSVINEELSVAKGWFVHSGDGIINDATLAEAAEFVHNPLPPRQQALLVQANQALGLDFSGIDWTVDRHGNMVLWEANAYPSRSGREDREHGLNDSLMRFLARAFALA